MKKYVCIGLGAAILWSVVSLQTMIISSLTGILHHKEILELSLVVDAVLIYVGSRIMIVGISSFAYFPSYLPKLHLFVNDQEWHDLVEWIQLRVLTNYRIWIIALYVSLTIMSIAITYYLEVKHITTIKMRASESLWMDVVFLVFLRLLLYLRREWLSLRRDVNKLKNNKGA